MAPPNLDDVFAPADATPPRVRIHVGATDDATTALLSPQLAAEPSAAEALALAADAAAAAAPTGAGGGPDSSDGGGEGQRLPVPSVVSLYSAWLDRFVRVEGTDGGLKADAEYPWSDGSWFTVLRLTSNFSIADPNEGWPVGGSGSGGGHARGRRLQQFHTTRRGGPHSGGAGRFAGGRGGGGQAAAAATATAASAASERMSLVPRAGAADAAVAEASVPSDVGGGGDEEEEQAAAAVDRSEILAEELWRGEEMGGRWFALASLATGRLLQLHDGKDGGKDGSLLWVATADSPPPTPRQLALAAAAAGAAAGGTAGGTPLANAAGVASGGALADAAAAGGGRHRAASRKLGGRKGPWYAPASACWRIDGDRLRNRGTGGVLNVRSGGNLRGHSNAGVPPALKQHDGSRFWGGVKYVSMSSSNRGVIAGVMEQLCFAC